MRGNSHGEEAELSPDCLVATGYEGPERRRHRVYVTRNTEYHFEVDRCVAVRDRRSGDFLPSHLAVERRLACGMRFYLNGAIEPNLEEPEIGEALYLPAPDRELVTSPVERIERPTAATIARYPRRVA